MFLLALWGIAYLSVGNELVVPAFSDCIKALGKLLGKAAFWKSFFASFLRAVSAFALSFLFATIFAVVAYLVPAFERIFAPVMAAFRSLPVLAVLLILLTFLSAGQAPVAVAFLSLFPMLYTGILAALSGIDGHLIEVSKVYGTSRWRKIFGVYLPLSAPYITREAGAALSFSVKLVVSAEVLASTARSLGGMMQEARAYLDIALLFALVLCSFALSLLVELVFSALSASIEKRVK